MAIERRNGRGPTAVHGPCEQCHRLMKRYWEAIIYFAQLEIELRASEESPEKGINAPLREKRYAAREHSREARRVLTDHIAFRHPGQ